MHCIALQTVALQDKNEVYMLADLVFLRKKKKKLKKKTSTCTILSHNTTGIWEHEKCGKHETYIEVNTFQTF